MRRNILTFREVTFLYGWIILYFLLETALVFFIYKFQAILVVLLDQTSKGLLETSVFCRQVGGYKILCKTLDLRRKDVNTLRAFWP